MTCCVVIRLPCDMLCGDVVIRLPCDMLCGDPSHRLDDLDDRRTSECLDSGLTWKRKVGALETDRQTDKRVRSWLNSLLDSSTAMDTHHLVTS